jgi:hypothetical protein
MSRSENAVTGILACQEAAACRPENTSPGEKLNQTKDVLCGDTVPPGWKPRLYVSQDG